MASTGFSSPSPYDSSVEKICSKQQEDWGEILEFCDRVSVDKAGPKEALRAIVKKIQGSNGKTASVAVTLLRACFNNGGAAFQKECAQTPLMDELYRLLQTRANTPYQVCEALKDMLQDWVLDQGGNPAYSRIHATYTRLKREGFEFPPTSRPIPAPAPAPTAGPGGDDAAAREEADLARAIAESLKDANKMQRKASKGKASKRRASASASTSTSTSTGIGARRVRALYTFEVQEAGELGFQAGDVITLLSDEHPDWWKGELNGATGLFPSNYVEPEAVGAMPGQPQLQGAGQAGAGAGDRAAGAGVVDELLDRLLTAQTTATDAGFNAEIERLYDIVVGSIHPEVHARLQAQTAKEAQLARLNEGLCTTMALYDRLSRDAQLAYQGLPPQ